MEKSFSLGVSPIIAALTGMFSVVMRGVIRDTLTNATPVIFRKEIYATACLAGATVYLIIHSFGIERDINLLISSGIIILLRIIVLKFELTLPKIGK